MALVVIMFVLVGVIGFAIRRANLVAAGGSQLNTLATVGLRRVGEGLMIVSAAGCALMIAALAL